MRPFQIAAALVTSFALVACSGDGSSDPSSDGTSPTATGEYGDASLFIDWTLGGQAPSATVCAGIDHLLLTINYRDGNQVTIEPIPCTLTRFRYDELPEGAASIELDALDTNGCTVASGTAGDTLSTTIPTAPQPTVAVSARRACR